MEINKFTRHKHLSPTQASKKRKNAQDNPDVPNAKKAKTNSADDQPKTAGNKQKKFKKKKVAENKSTEKTVAKGSVKKKKHKKDRNKENVTEK